MKTNVERVIVSLQTIRDSYSKVLVFRSTNQDKFTLLRVLAHNMLYCTLMPLLHEAEKDEVLAGNIVQDILEVFVHNSLGGHVFEDSENKSAINALIGILEQYKSLRISEEINWHVFEQYLGLFTSSLQNA